ncbi:MAG: VWA domain-containing protein [Patescibacteria group bacterium]|nr:VWA domain-containing protein [Patescibacteria group bacterium]
MKIRKKKYTSHKKIKKKSSFFYSRGKGSILLLLIGVIILGSIVLSGGIFPKQNLEPTQYDSAGILVSQTPQPDHKNLQLNTLKFKECESDAAVDFLIDVSNSMSSENKMTDLKNALNIFGAVFPGGGVLAMQIFTSPDGHGLPPTGYRELIPFSYYNDVRPGYQSIVSSLEGLSGTHTKDAFVFAKSKIENALKDPRFENKKFNLIFISDGVPETLARNTEGEDNKECTPSGTDSEFCTASRFQRSGDPRYANACRCFDTAQDPTSVAAEIKQLTNKKGDPVKIYSIGYVSSEDDHFKEKLKTLMQNVASSDDNPPCPQDDPNGDFCNAPIGEKIKDILVGKIIKKICSE